MPSRQERRKAERDAAKRAPAKAGAAAAGAAGAGAAGSGGGAATARANVNGNPVGDWTTQAEDPYVLFREIGAQVEQRARAGGDREAQYSQGFRLVSEVDRAAGATQLGASGRSPKSGNARPVFRNRSRVLWTSSVGIKGITA